MAIVKSYIEAPKFAQFGNALRQFCFKRDYPLKLETEKGLFRETIYFEIDCPDKEVELVKNTIETVIQNYNSN
jgi:hypothetical protein